MTSKYTKKQKKAAKIISNAAIIFHKSFFKHEEFRTQFKDGYIALRTFLGHYAYERQGTNQEFKKIAFEVIENLFGNKRVKLVFKSNHAKKSWVEYKRVAEKYGITKLNPTRNPMNEDKSVIKILANKEIPNIAKYTLQLLKRKRTEEIYNLIMGISGVGEKIVPMYLRDIAHLKKIPETKISNPELLQPVDIWVDRVILILASRKFERGPEKQVREKQEFIVGLCKEANVSGIEFNQGAWLLGSRIAGNLGILKKIVFNENKLKKQIKEVIKEQKEQIKKEKKDIRILNQFVEKLK